MSKGKYSPYTPNINEDFDFYRFNCYGEEPTEWTLEMKNSGKEFDEKTMLGNYDSDGFDRYGYSAFDNDGKYVNIGSGIDRLGNTEMDYLGMTDDEFRAAQYDSIQTAFIRNRD